MEAKEEDIYSFFLLVRQSNYLQRGILFAIISYDWYVPVRNPWRYPTLTMRKECSQLVLGMWAGGLVMVLLPVVSKTRLLYCGPNIIDHNFCDSTPLLHLTS